MNIANQALEGIRNNKKSVMYTGIVVFVATLILVTIITVIAVAAITKGKMKCYQVLPPTGYGWDGKLLS